jgi:hypothetical protein
MDLAADLYQVVKIARAEGHPVESLTCHCAWANKPSDPGKAFIEQVMVPVSEQLDLEIDWDFKSKPKAKTMGEVCKLSQS